METGKVKRDRGNIMITLPERELAALEGLAEHHGMSRNGVVRQALRLYHQVHVRLREGETLSFSGDARRAAVFVGAVGLGER